MKKKLPFYWSSMRTRVFWISAAIAIMHSTFLQWVDTHLQNDSSPHGIVSFELAGTIERVDEILGSWLGDAKSYAKISLWFDFPFIAAYAMAFGMGCVIVAERFADEMPMLRKLGVALIWGILLAAILDCFENYLLISLLHGSRSPYLPMIASFCALIKFLIILACTLYILGGWFASRHLSRC